MGYRGKLTERRRARELRAAAWTLQDIADQLGVSKSSVSLWVRDVDFTPRPRKRTARRRGPNKLQQAKAAEIERLRREGRERIGCLTEQEFLVAGVALYAGEGFKRDGVVGMANNDPGIMAFFCAWLRHFFHVDEQRLRARLYLHDGLDLAAATDHWSDVTGIPHSQFAKPYRAIPKEGIRTAKHVNGCLTVRYSCSATSRLVSGMMEGLTGFPVLQPGKPLVSLSDVHFPG